MANSRLNSLLLWQVKGSEDSRALSLSRKELNSFENRCQQTAGSPREQAAAQVHLDLVNLVDASHNRIKEVYGLTDIAPSAWWINLRHNGLVDSTNLQDLPKALGMLDIACNPVTSDSLHVLAHTHILRLYMDVGGTIQKDRDVLCMCPNVWVLNENYFAYKERAAMEQIATNSDVWQGIEQRSVGNGSLGSGSLRQGDNIMRTEERIEESLTGSLVLSVQEKEIDDDTVATPAEPMDEFSLSSAHIPITTSLTRAAARESHLRDSWTSRVPGNRESAYLAALHTFTPTAAYPIDFYRLDVLLEDYLDEAFLANASNPAIPFKAVRGAKYPVVDVMTLIALPRRIKMDLSVILSINIIIGLPKLLLNDVLIHLTIGHMSVQAAKDLFSAPCFVKTALVALLRRVLNKEEEELRRYGTLIDKNKLCAYKQPKKRGHEFIPTFSGTSEGWAHMFPAKCYLHTSLEVLERTLHMFNGGRMPEGLVQQKAGPVTTVPSLSDMNSLGSADINASLMESSMGASVSSSATGDGSMGVSTRLAPHRFSLLEFQLLVSLPDIVTPTTPFFEPEKTNESQWINLAARHTVILLAKSDLCPNLTKPQLSTKAQTTYIDLLPLLTLAKMTLSNLSELDDEVVEVKNTWHGRENIIKSVTKEESAYIESKRIAIAGAGGSNNAGAFITTVHEEHKAARSVNSSALDLVGEQKDVSILEKLLADKINKRYALVDGAELGFGAGLPRGGASNLTWRQEGKQYTRTYDLWNDHKFPDRKELRQMQLEHLRYSQARIESVLRGRGIHTNPSSPSGGTRPMSEAARIANPVGFPLANNEVEMDALSLGTMSCVSNDGFIQMEEISPEVDTSVVLDSNANRVRSVVVQFPNEPSAANIDPLTDTMITTANAGSDYSPTQNVSGGGNAGQTKSSSHQHMPSMDLTLQSGVGRSLIPDSAFDQGINVDLKGSHFASIAHDHSLNESQQTSLMRNVYQDINAPVAGPLSPQTALNGLQKVKVRAQSPQVLEIIHSVALGTSPHKKANVINGFSVNASAESSFLLAPTSVVIKKNRQVDSPTAKLTMLHQAPVMIHPSMPSILPIPEEILKETQSGNHMIDIPATDGIPNEFPGKYQYSATMQSYDEDQHSVGGSVSLASSNSESTIHPASSARNLLAEMGTLRNIRNLLIDDGAYKVPKSTIGAGFGNQGQGESQSQSWGGRRGGSDSGYGQEFRFGNDSGDISRNMGGYDGTAGRGTTGRQSQAAQSKVFKARDLDTIITAADLVKMKSGYMHVFTTNSATNVGKGYTNSLARNDGKLNGGQMGQQQGMKQAEKSVDGRPISSSWYPVPKKPTFTLAPDSKDAIDQAVRALYGGEFAGPVTQSHSQNPASPIVAVKKKKNQVTYITQKLQVKQVGNVLPFNIEHPAIADEAAGVTRGVQVEGNRKNKRFTNNIYENNHASANVRQFAQNATSKNAVNMYMNSDVSADLNNMTHMQPAVKTKIMMTASNYNNDNSSLDGTREIYHYKPKLGLSKSFKVKSNTQLPDVGIKFSAMS